MFERCSPARNLADTSIRAAAWPVAVEIAERAHEDRV
jgi:hypothetical protein